MAKLSQEQVEKLTRVISQVDHMLNEEQVTHGEFTALLSIYMKQLKPDALCYMYSEITKLLEEEPKDELFKIFKDILKP